MIKMIHSVFVVTAILSAAVVVPAQTAKPPAAASATKSSPDLSGVWLGKPANQWAFSKDALPMKPEAEERFKYNTVDWNDPSGPGRKELDPFIVSCAPPGVPRIWLINRPFEIIQKPNRIILLYEADHTFRQVWMDGRKHPEDFGNNWTGHSIGNWDGDTLVIDTVGLNGEPWLDNSGHTYSDAMHLIERIRRLDRNNLAIEVTIDDPKAYTKTWTGRRLAVLQPGRTIRENLACDGVMNGE
jgi:hypothetical protein